MNRYRFSVNLRETNALGCATRSFVVPVITARSQDAAHDFGRWLYEAWSQANNYRWDVAPAYYQNFPLTKQLADDARVSV